MNETESSCEITARPANQVTSSRVLKLGPNFRWSGVIAEEYKAAAAHHAGVTRMALVGGQGEARRLFTCAISRSRRAAIRRWSITSMSMP